MKISSAKDVYDYCIPKLSKVDREHFVVLHLNSKNRVLKYETVAIGTLNQTLIHPREVFKSAIKWNSNAIILVHNHPSGDVEPSEEDIEITDLLTKAGDLLSIKVLDHVIVGKEKYWSWEE
jgi:DNA repair protein RadC